MDVESVVEILDVKGDYGEKTFANCSLQAWASPSSATESRIPYVDRR